MLESSDISHRLGRRNDHRVMEHLKSLNLVGAVIYSLSSQ